MRPPMSSALFPDVVFGRTLSLGANCETAHFLRLNDRHGRGLFDWLVTPFNAIERVLADHGAKLGTKFIAVQNGTSVRCGVYGILYDHEFARGDHNNVRFDIAAIERCRSKLTYKWRQFVDVCEGDEPVLFIRFAGGSNLDWDCIDPARALLGVGDLNRLVASLETRFPHLVFRILLILTFKYQELTGGSVDELDRRGAVEQVAPKTEGTWRTMQGDRSELLGRIRFRSAPEFGGLGETLHGSGETDEVSTGLVALVRDRMAKGAASISSVEGPKQPGTSDIVADQIAAEVRLCDFGQALEGCDVIGTISPHPGLASALKARFSIREVIAYVIPGEGRLPSKAQNRGAVTHFPTVYETILADLEHRTLIRSRSATLNALSSLCFPGWSKSEKSDVALEVPGPGCLVAGRLLGKIYCARIKALGALRLTSGRSSMRRWVSTRDRVSLSASAH